MDSPEDKRGLIRFAPGALTRSSNPLVRRGLDLAALVRRYGATLPENLKSIASRDENAIAFVEIGMARWKADDVDGAVTAFRKAIELDPGLAIAYYSLGTALEREGQLDDAIAEYQKAIELEPTRALLHAALGDALFERGRLDDAVAKWQKAIELDPNYALTHYNLGPCSTRKGSVMTQSRSTTKQSS